MRNPSVLIRLIVLVTLGCLTAAASSLTITFVSSTLTTSVGGTVSFFGNLSNTTSGTVFLNGDNFNLTGLPPSSISDSPFFTNAPVSLGGHDATGDIELFDVDLPNSLKPGNYGGSFQILGGADDNAQNILGTATFTIRLGGTSAVPEPDPAALISIGAVVITLALIAGLRRTSISRHH